MAALPDRFDLWVRRARAEINSERQTDALIGLLFAEEEWFLWNRGAVEKPVPAMVEIEDQHYLLIFSSLEKLITTVQESTRCTTTEVSQIAIPTEAATAFCLRFREAQCSGLLVNPGDYAYTIDFVALEAFDAAWRVRKATSRGFWIPNMTTEEEDFWQERGL